MDDIVLDFRRELTFSVGSDTCQGELKIPKIVYLPERKKWGCHWSITFIKEEPMCIYGDDPLQALTRTLEAVSKLLQNSGIPDLKVWWKNEGDNGMPL